MALQKTDKIWHNGKFIRWEDATLHVMSHVVHYGSSVFEGIRCYVPSSGPAIFRADDHIQRLLDSAKVYRMDLPFSREAHCLRRKVPRNEPERRVRVFAGFADSNQRDDWGLH